MSKQDNPLLRKLSETFTNGRCITTTDIKFVKHKIFPVQNNHIARFDTLIIEQCSLAIRWRIKFLCFYTLFKKRNENSSILTHFLW